MKSPSFKNFSTWWTKTKVVLYPMYSTPLTPTVAVISQYVHFCTQAELLEIMDVLGIPSSPEEVERLISEIDIGIFDFQRFLLNSLYHPLPNTVDGDGTIDFNEFVQVMSSDKNVHHSGQVLKHAFSLFEISSSKISAGSISVDALVAAIVTYGSGITRKEALELVKDLDMDANGAFNYEDFINSMKDV